MLRGNRLIQSNFLDALKFGCIPVILSSEYILPFMEVLDWKRAALVFNEDQLLSLPAILSSISTKRRRSLRQQVNLKSLFLYHSMQRSMIPRVIKRIIFCFFSFLGDVLLAFLFQINRINYTYNITDNKRSNFF